MKQYFNYNKKVIIVKKFWLDNDNCTDYDAHPDAPAGKSTGRGGKEFMKRFRFGLALLILLLIVIPLLLEAVPLNLTVILAKLRTYVVIYLGIFIEAAPFLLLGSVVSGMISVYVSQESLARFIPRQPLLAAVAGALLGLVFPVCECGVVPVVRRLYQKGVPLPVGVSFLLAAPILNPVVIASTATAFGWGSMLAGRLGVSLLIASIVGMMFHFARPEEVLRPGLKLSACHTGCCCSHEVGKGGKKIWDALAAAGDDFVEMVRYLIIGSLLAAGMQTLVPQSMLVGLASGPILSILVMVVLAFVLSVCSTVDAFLALAFVNVFPPAAILSFLVFGPMVDIKSALMFAGVFRRRPVIYLILLPLTMSVLAALALNLFGGW